jgi:predicted DNA-binding transcriptional regulator YafY
MQTELFLPIAERAIRERRNIEIDYESPDGRERHKRIVSPFDVGSTDPELAERFKDNLYAFSPDHLNRDTEEPEPQVLVFAIGKVHSARLLDETFDPEQLRTISLQHDDVDWGGRDFNLVPDRGWFVPADLRSR